METIFKTDLLTRICCKKQVRKCVLLEGRGGKALQQRLDPWFWDPVVIFLQTAHVILSTCFMPLWIIAPSVKRTF